MKYIVGREETSRKGFYASWNENFQLFFSPIIIITYASAQSPMLMVFAHSLLQNLKLEIMFSHRHLCMDVIMLVF